MKPARSRAAWYSAFSERSPWARASPMACELAGRSTVFRRCSSLRSRSAPRRVMGVFISGDHRFDARLLEARIRDIEAKLANAQIVDPKLVDAEGRCVFGATVDIESDGEKATWQIVGEDEADIKAGRISYSSPIGKALIGKESGEIVEVHTPGGVKRYEIIDVRYE